MTTARGVVRFEGHEVWADRPARKVEARRRAKAAADLAAFIRKVTGGRLPAPAPAPDQGRSFMRNAVVAAGRTMPGPGSRPRPGSRGDRHWTKRRGRLAGTDVMVPPTDVMVPPTDVMVPADDRPGHVPENDWE